MAQVLDKEGAVERLGEDEELWLEIVAVFLGDIPQERGNLQAAVADKDYKSAGRNAHSIKSAAANIGGMRVSDIAMQLEEAAMRQEYEKIPALLTELDSAISELETILNPLIGG